MKKKFGKILSILLTVAMMLSLVPATAFAGVSEDIESVTISDVDEPVIGATPDFDITLTMTGATLDESEGYDPIGWCKFIPGENPWEDSWEYMDESTEFGEGLYALEIYLKAEDGYKFTDATQFYFDEEELPAWSDAYESCYSLWSEDGGYADIFLYFTLGEFEPRPETYTVTVTTDGNGTATANPATAAEGDTVTLQAAAKNSSYEFEKWEVVSGDVTLADAAAATTTFTMPAEAVKVKASFTEKADDTPGVIKTIKIKGITPPAAGELPVFTGITSDTPGITLRTLQWLRPDASIMNDRYTFEPGVTYTFFANFTVAAGYEFGDSLSVTHDLPGGEIKNINITSNFVTISYTVPGEVNTYTVSFDANGGGGTMEAKTGISGEYKLPECEFTAPSGQQFKAWRVNGVEYVAGKTIYVGTDTTVTAVWEKSDALKTTISNISIKGITPPVAGKLPVFTGITSDTPGITLHTLQWLTPESTVMNGRLTFAVGETYTFYTGFVIDEENYKLADSVTVTHDLAGGVFDRINKSTQFVTIDYTVPETPVMDDVYRVYGLSRCDTALKAADTLKEVMGVSKFNTVIVANAQNFADALGGSYLAAKKDAPILMTNIQNEAKVKEYIRNNLKNGGTIYILGGPLAVASSFETGMGSFNVKRLYGTSRYDTNLEILKEVGVARGAEVLVCTGTNFADSLSASATGKPILMVGNSMTANQKAYLSALNAEYTIIGGPLAVNANVETELKGLGDTERIYGTSRFDTSVVVAQQFFRSPEAMVLAYAQNFPDGLSGGPLAYNVNGPLVLTQNGKQTAAAAYADANDIKGGYVMGGTMLISDDTVRNIFDMEASDPVIVK